MSLSSCSPSWWPRTCWTLWPLTSTLRRRSTLELHTQMKRKPIKSSFYKYTGTRIIQRQALMKESKKNQTVGTNFSYQYPDAAWCIKGMESLVYLPVHWLLTVRGLIENAPCSFFLMGFCYTSVFWFSPTADMTNRKIRSAVAAFILVSNKLTVTVNILLTHKLMCDKIGSHKRFWCYAEATTTGQQQIRSPWLPAGPALRSLLEMQKKKMTFKLSLLCLVT